MSARRIKVRPPKPAPVGAEGGCRYSSSTHSYRARVPEWDIAAVVPHGATTIKPTGCQCFRREPCDLCLALHDTASGTTAGHPSPLAVRR